MDKTFIEQLVRLLETSPLKEIEHTVDGERIRLVKADGSSFSGSSSKRTVQSTDAPIQQPVRPKASHQIEASLVGLFYRSPAPDQPPFVKVGDVVEEGQVLCIVEAMKMLNQVEADCAGRVVRVVCDDGSAVEPGTLLFELEPLEAKNV